MNSSTFRVRRATLDDISDLAALWNSMKFPADTLSKRVTDFQVAEKSDGGLVGAVGLEIAQKQGRIHSEAFTDFALADELRPKLWERIRAVATNHGLLRLWTQEKAPFWSHCGLVKSDPEALEKLPSLWQGQKADWLTLKLKDDIETLKVLRARLSDPHIKVREAVRAALERIEKKVEPKKDPEPKKEPAP